MTTTEKFKSDVEGLWKLSIRTGLACKRIKIELNENGGQQVEYAEVLARHGNMLLRVASDVADIPIPNLGQQFVMEIAAKDRTARRGISNVRNELAVLKDRSNPNSSTADAIFLHAQALEAIKQAVRIYRLAIGGNEYLTVSEVSKKTQAIKTSSRHLNKKYRQLNLTTDNAYLMSFVDHLLLSVKATLEEPLIETEETLEEDAFLSNWAEMQAISDDKVRKIATSKDIQYLSGAVDVEAVLKSALETISGSLNSDGTSAKPLGALMYSLTLLELAAAIVSTLKT